MQTRIFTRAPNTSQNVSAQTVKLASINERREDGKPTSDASFEMGIGDANVARHLWPFTYKGKHLPQRQLVSALMLVDFMNQVLNLQTAQLVAFAQLSDAVYCLRDRRPIGPLAFQELLLRFDSPPISSQVAVTADYAMTRDRQRHGIRSTDAGDCANSFRFANLARDLGVAARFAARNPLQRLPNFLLEGGRAHVKRQIDRGLLAVEAGQQRLNVTTHGRIVAVQRRCVELFPKVPLHLGRALAKANSAQPALGRGNQHSSQRS